MDLDNLISLLQQAEAPASRTATIEVGLVNISSEQPFDVQSNVRAIEKSKIFEELAVESMAKALQTGKKPKGSRKKVILPGTGGDFEANLRESLKQQVKSNMGTNGALVNRTGQFLNSVKATKVVTDKKGLISVFYTYMKFPYATFGKGGRQYSKNRDPDALIVTSIKQIALKQAVKRLKAVPA